MGIIKTSQEINKSWGTYRNKFYGKRKMITEQAISCGEDVWICQIAVKQHDDGLVCPFCGGKPNSIDWNDKVEYGGYNGELHIGLNPYIVSEGSCADCGKWWMIRSCIHGDKVSNVVMYDIPRTCHTFDGDMLKLRQKK
jgi:hypothetical protein